MQILLDAPVQQYLPLFRLAGAAASSVVTVRELLNQTSGIGTGAGEDASLCRPSTTPEDMVRSLAKVRPTAPPGRSFQYSNANYISLGVLVESVYGQPYADYVEQHILAPLDMTNTFLSGEQALQHGVAVGHRTVAGRSESAAPGYFCPGYLGAGFIVSTAQDMTHWLIAHLNQGRYCSRSVLSPAGIAELHRPGMSTGSRLGPGSGYGMGWIVGTSLGVPVIWHDGDDSYGLPQLLLLLPWHVSLLLVSGAFAAAWALARTGLVVRARRRDPERTC